MPPLQYKLGAQVRGLDLEAPFNGGTERLLDRFARLWLLASREAVGHSGLEPEQLVNGAVVTGTALGGQTTQDDLFNALYREGRQRLTPLRGTPDHVERGGQPRLDGAGNARAGVHGLHRLLVPRTTRLVSLTGRCLRARRRWR